MNESEPVVDRGMKSSTERTRQYRARLRQRTADSEGEHTPVSEPPPFTVVPVILTSDLLEHVNSRGSCASVVLRELAECDLATARLHKLCQAENHAPLAAAETHPEKAENFLKAGPGRVDVHRTTNNAPLQQRIMHCRRHLGMTVVETARRLAISESAVRRADTAWNQAHHNPLVNNGEQPATETACQWNHSRHSGRKKV